MIPPAAAEVARRRFEAADQDAFARLSGDFNPLHVDAVAARRLVFGGPVAHGVHVMLWALDVVAPDRAAVARIKAEFTQPVPVGAEVAFSAATPAPGRQRLTVSTDDGPAVAIDVAWADAPPAPTAEPAAGAPERRAPRVLTAADAEGLEGSVELLLERALAAEMFPRLAAAMDLGELAALIAASRVVGMECPGAHSIFAGLELEAAEGEATDGAPEFVYRVAKVRAKLALAEIDVAGGGIRGRLRALFRPEPAAQPTFEALAALVEADEFAGRRALVVGGSRGLGEVAAKLLAAGGAEVWLTYRQGGSDAERVAAEITTAGGRAECLALDVDAPAVELQAALESLAPTDVLYFATPHIGGGVPGRFSEARHARLMRAYVDGFRAVLDAFAEGGAGLRVLYPSSVYVDDTPANMAEYAAAKAAGEDAAAALAKARGFVLTRPRFPRLATDQTQSVLPAEAADAGQAVLDALRRLGGDG